MSGTISVEVVFADKDSQYLIEVTLPADATVASAIAASGVESASSDHDLCNLPVGIWGKVVPRDRVVCDGDRVEVYRELEVDPMEARRIRATAPDPGPYGSR